jgi:hypothetical protein
VTSPGPHVSVLYLRSASYVTNTTVRSPRNPETHPATGRYAPTTRGFRLVHVPESANPRASGYGDIAYRHISDTYIALFSHFIPCGVWEAVYLFEGLLKNESEVTVDIVHGDTQGQSLPVFGLAHMLGIELLPRIRNWKDLVFYRPSSTVSKARISLSCANCCPYVTLVFEVCR